MDCNQCLSNDNALFYVNERRYLCSVVIDPYELSVIQHQKILKVKHSSKPGSLGMAHLSLKAGKTKEDVIILFGIKPSGSLYWFKNEKAIKIPEINLGDLQQYSLISHAKKKLFITGGAIDGKPQRKTYYLTFSLNPKTKELNVKQNQVKQLLEPRYGHSSCLIKQYLYVLFGKHNEAQYCDTLEFWNIYYTIGFQALKLTKRLELFQPMLFVHNDSMIFFGGLSEAANQAVFQLDFNRDKLGQGKRLSAKPVELELKFMMMRGSEKFQQTMKNCVRSGEIEQYVCMDEKGGLYMVDFKQRQTDYMGIEEIQSD